jgi:polar amino acid transport system substrate-binding protein
MKGSQVSGPRGTWRAAVLAIAIAGVAAFVASAQTPAPQSPPQQPVLPQPTAPLRLVSTAWTPFTNPPGQPRFALDLVEAALGRLGVTSNTAIVEPAQFTDALLTGRYDGTAAAWRDAEREKVLLFSQPYLENRLILVGRKGTDVSAPAFLQLAGRKVAIVGGYAYGEIDKAGPTFVRSQSEEDSLRMLLAKEVDYVLMDELVVQYLAGRYAKETSAKLAFGTTALLTRKLYFAVRRDLPGAQAVIDGFNAQLRGLITDRTYHKLLHVPWIEADVDGDGLTELIPASDKAGPDEPQRAYKLFTDTPGEGQTGITSRTILAHETASGKRFYYGGTIYETWASVPEQYRGPRNPNMPDSSRSTASIFTFTW